MSPQEQLPHVNPPALITNHIIHFICPVTARSIQLLQNVCLGAICAPGASNIELRISSQGGDLAAGFAAYGFLQSLPVPLHTHNISNVESVATVMYLAGTTRTAASHSRFVIHPLHWGMMQGAVDHNRLSEWSESLNFDRDRYATIFQEATNSSQCPIDIHKHLKELALIVDVGAATAAGITTRASDHKIAPPSESINWWVDGF